jgi:hypothetical protein
LTYQFAELPWGASYEQVERSLAGRGFEFEGRDEVGNLSFSGSLLGNEATVYALFAHGNLIKVNLLLLPPEHRLFEVYDGMKASLVKKYGPPENSYAFFEEPFEAGDGYEMTAIFSGKATFSAYWPMTGVSTGTALYIEITERLVVSISYESPSWSAELERRQAAELDIL